MRTFYRRLCLPALAIVLASAASAATPLDSARPAILAGYDGLSVAFTQHDLNRFMTYFTPDYTVVDEKGHRFTREETRKQYAGQLAQIKSMQSRYTVGGLSPAPGGVLVEMRMHSSGVGEKRILFAKFHANYTDDLWVRDTWVNTAQGWRIRTRQTLQDKMQIHR